MGGTPLYGINGTCNRVGFSGFFVFGVSVPMVIYRNLTRSQILQVFLLVLTSVDVRILG